MQLAIAGRNASIDAVNTLLNGGTLEIRTGAPAAIDGAPSGSVLATLNINATAFSAASAGSATFNVIVDVTATGAGTAGHYVAKDSGGNPERNGTAGASGTDMILNNTTFGIGDDVSVTNWTYSQSTS
tara:strand:- start:316 stop:699 length:384 start_codon:yes stop_codon:yes gene_type:complete